MGTAQLCAHLCHSCRLTELQLCGLFVFGLLQVLYLTTCAPAAPLDAFLSSLSRLYLLKNLSEIQDFLLLQFLTAEGSGICRSGVWDRGLAPPGVCPTALIPPPSSWSKLLQHYPHPHPPAGYYTIEIAKPIDPSSRKHGGILQKVRLTSAGMHRRCQHTTLFACAFSVWSHRY